VAPRGLGSELGSQVEEDLAGQPERNPVVWVDTDGLDAALERHRMLSRAVKDGVEALGLDLFGEGLEENWTVTAIRAPDGIDADTIARAIREDFGVVLAPGQGPLKGKVVRIGHFGYFDRLDIIRGLAALEMTLERLGHPVKRGAAVAAAEGVFAEAGVPPGA
jgi:aspartate aminotransferase-like enzyme